MKQVHIRRHMYTVIYCMYAHTSTDIHNMCIYFHIYLLVDTLVFHPPPPHQPNPQLISARPR
jgi:hypothetical protein